MISDLDGSLESRYVLNVVNDRTCFASCACAFKGSGLITCLECTHGLTKKLSKVLARLNEIN